MNSFCSQCGKALADDVKFCSGCGNKRPAPEVDIKTPVTVLKFLFLLVFLIWWLAEPFSHPASLLDGSHVSSLIIFILAGLIRWRGTTPAAKLSVKILVGFAIYLFIQGQPKQLTWRDAMDARGIHDRDLQDAVRKMDQLVCAQREASSADGNGASVGACFH
jgi:hypothetical protein